MSLGVLREDVCCPLLAVPTDRFSDRFSGRSLGDLFFVGTSVFAGIPSDLCTDVLAEVFVVAEMFVAACSNAFMGMPADIFAVALAGMFVNASFDTLLVGTSAGDLSTVC